MQQTCAALGRVLQFINELRAFCRLQESQKWLLVYVPEYFARVRHRHADPSDADYFARGPHSGVCKPEGKCICPIFHVPTYCPT